MASEYEHGNKHSKKIFLEGLAPMLSGFLFGSILILAIRSTQEVGKKTTVADIIVLWTASPMLNIIATVILFLATLSANQFVDKYNTTDNEQHKTLFFSVANKLILILFFFSLTMMIQALGFIDLTQYTQNVQFITKQ